MMYTNSFADLPQEIRQSLEKASSDQYLEILSAAALDPANTHIIFARYDHLFVEFCGRWLSSVRAGKSHSLPVLSAVARVLPCARHLVVYLDEIIRTQLPSTSDDTHRDVAWKSLSLQPDLDPAALPEHQLVDLLLTAYRLLNFDNAAFAPSIAPSKLMPLLQHSSRPVRYLAICNLRSYLHAADFFMQSMVEKHLGNDSIEGQWEGKMIDFGFLALWEEKRWEMLDKELSFHRPSREEHHKVPPTWGRLSPWTADVCGLLLPRLCGSPDSPSALVFTPTTTRNMRALVEAVLSPDPILITGQAGSGKTSLITDLARELGTADSMLTLHLNEQTDAKLLIGMYTTASTPGSFTWRPGVLTTAVREGRWVLIEDLNRAPTEVLGALLPLLEKRELLIPSRGEKVQAARGFKLLATMPTVLNSRGEESPAVPNLLGASRWTRVLFSPSPLEEFNDIIYSMYPRLRSFLPMIMRVYDRIQAAFADSTFATKSRTSLGRPLSPRDLLKWCRRIDQLLMAARAGNGSEPIPEGTKDDIFMEAADCLAASMQSTDARIAILRLIGEEMHLPPQRVDHFVSAHQPKLSSTDKTTRIGRATLSKRKMTKSTRHQRNVHSQRPFATTTPALCLLEQVAVAVKAKEPVLLVGETGTGKTTVIQQLADFIGRTLSVVNLSQQSEGGDLLGGFKPIDPRSLAMPMKDEFDSLFDLTFSGKKNQRYLDMLGRCVAKGQWTRVVTLWKEALNMVDGLVSSMATPDPPSPRTETGQPKKRRRLGLGNQTGLHHRWARFAQEVKSLDMQLSNGSDNFAFHFVEGNLVKAARNGEWVLLDEINLASPDTLESIADLLQTDGGRSPSLLLAEKGDLERIQAHPDFRIFGAMNPATDMGKKDLPRGLRTAFTEIYVDSPDRDLGTLMSVVDVYLERFTHSDKRATGDVARLYLDVRQLADEDRLVDGANQRPHFSLRTLTRTLMYVVDVAPAYGLCRALYEGFSMSFLSLLDHTSELLVIPLIDKHLLREHGNVRSLLNRVPRPPTDGKAYVQFEHYWMLQGNHAVVEQPHYIITPFVRRNLLDLIRATSTRRFPVLVQGPTSSGKTSMIEYLASITGNKFVRINNHEHTDLQEYLGTYISGHHGRLHFQEGVLVQALREGSWVVLDELNLAPSDVLEALNRLLDDNRELLIPETQTVVRPHPNFMLFATQNPPGLYGGRKVLSRAFRNRFLELHFDDIPDAELETILRERTQIAPSFCTKIVAVYKELSLLRQSDRVFEQRNSYATLRDLFRWALRDADDRERLAANGFMLLAERVRKPEERLAVKNVIEKVMKVKIDEEALYLQPNLAMTENLHGVVWTKAMRRLFVLVSHAIQQNEPVLLVGETGCGKTTVCQLLAERFGKELYSVNAHQNMETGDLIGAQRPLRNRSGIELDLREDLSSAFRHHLHITNFESDDVEALLKIYETLGPEVLAKVPPEMADRIRRSRSRLQTLFQWSDGALIHAMQAGQFFLLDEISLADDSVLERLNSVLETDRSLLLAEKGPFDSFVKAHDGFQFMATMNPGGDYGKRELSPALRNRFTEIWVPPAADPADVREIARSKLTSAAKYFAGALVNFAQWFSNNFSPTAASSLSIRDILAWVRFINSCESSDPYFAILHGAAMVFIDTLGASPAAMLAVAADRIDEERRLCLAHLGKLLGRDVSSIYFDPVHPSLSDGLLKIGPFSVPAKQTVLNDTAFNLQAPTTALNAMRVIRALKVSKPILLEGNPGVGKTTLITALARAIGKPLTRINLSEQTDLMDLFGSDVPMEGADAGHFIWRDAAFLQAMQRGHWVLLDEMNLASQSVLEGLNACLDHRRKVYISELDKTFTQHPDFTVFAAQNPHHQGGGRKGLPTSFVNRFTVVYADVFRPEDLALICGQSFPHHPRRDIDQLLRFVAAVEDRVVRKGEFGTLGGPWEFNLRDVVRWLQLLTSTDQLLPAGTAHDFLDTIFTQRFRTPDDRAKVASIFSEVFGVDCNGRQLFHNLNPTSVQVGLGLLGRDASLQPISFPSFSLSKTHLPVMESIMICVQQRWPSILVSPSGSGKSSLLKCLAAMTGAGLVEFALNSDTDTMDLIGGYEQTDNTRHMIALWESLEAFVRLQVISQLTAKSMPLEILSLFEILQSRAHDRNGLLKIRNIVSTLSERFPHEKWTAFLARCEEILRVSQQDGKARFEWIDGMLVNALQDGKWLVLDNANLCNSSVLDRLNSLLEPNGLLSVDEHRSSGGEARIIRPHPDFRLFITMDPRHGELSRAMRNRAIEIFMGPAGSHQQLTRGASDAFCDSQTSRYRLLKSFQDRGTELTSAFADVGMSHLSQSDRHNFPRWGQQVHAGLIELGDDGDSLVSLAADRFLTSRSLEMSQPDAASEFYQVSENTMLDIDTQPSHILVNTPLLSMPHVSNTRRRAYWIAFMQDVVLETCYMLQRLRHVREQAQTLKPSQMSRLARSYASSRLPELSKDSTAPTHSFIDAVFRAIIDWTRSASAWHSPNQHQTLKAFLPTLTSLWWSTYETVNDQTFDESQFQVHLILWRSLLDTTLGGDVLELRSRVAHKLDEFRSAWQLSFGLSMERLWTVFRPQVASTVGQLEIRLQLEQLASRFDAIVWRCEASLGDIFSLRTTIQGALQAMLSSGSGSFTAPSKHVEEAILELESKLQDKETSATPYFQTEFETLCQHHDLRWSHNRDGEQVMSLHSYVPLLANRTIQSMAAQGPSGWSNAALFSDLSSYVGGGQGYDQRLAALKGTFASSTLRKINHLSNVTLRQLDLVRVEANVLGRSLSTSTTLLCSDQLTELNSCLSDILKEVLGAHSDLCDDIEYGGALAALENVSSPLTDSAASYIGTIYGKELPPDHHFRQISDVYLRPSIVALAGSSQDGPSSYADAARAWFLAATGMLLLYVPDKAFDPALKPLVERKIHDRRRADLELKLEALQNFEGFFTGQPTTLRCEVVQQAMTNLGVTPSIPAVARPQHSQLTQLQGEFSNLLNSIVNVCQRDSFRHGLFSGDGALQEAKLLQINISQVAQRLSHGYRAYDDLTQPVVGMLQCLDVGLSLAEMSNNERRFTENAAIQICHRSPFLGGHPKELFGSVLYNPSSLSTASADARVHHLRWMALVGNVESLSGIGGGALYELMRTFHSFYEEWKEQLATDQQEASAKSGLYRYRGDEDKGDEAEEAELEVLFPSYDASKPTGKSSKATPAELASQLASLHNLVLCDTGNAADGLLSLLENAVTTMVKSDQSHPDSSVPRRLNQKLLAATILGVDRMTRSLSSCSSSSAGHNFYTDSNLGEATKLVNLVHRIQRRFDQLQQAWPEHATLQDVLNTCEEVLDFEHDEPVAKFLTKAEKLHGSIHEWQVVASKAFSAVTLYDRLTAMLISWRRLELSTWARLFDFETDKCVADAKSWWYVAYEAIVAVPLSLVDNGEKPDQYAVQLLSVLESFFATTTMGQYSQRLRLLEQFKEHMSLLEQNIESMAVISRALTNFIGFYSRFESQIQKGLQAGRQTLEKDMKEVVLLASWKDTNINALRDSAKRSHHKLFKIVRKYRALLGQPVEGLLKQGLPDVNETFVSAAVINGITRPPALDGRAVAICQNSVSGWSQKPLRLVNVDSTVETMERTALVPVAAMDGGQYIESFAANLIGSMEILQKQTPTTLTDENKDNFKHLKSRKRKLYADTLKELRRMGFKHNLGADLLAQQADLPTVLAKAPPLPANADLDNLDAINSYFYKVVDLMPRARETTRNHSDDLTAAEVVRSTGYLEGIFVEMVKQRGILASSVEDLRAVNLVTEKLGKLWAPERYALRQTHLSASSDSGGLKRAIYWLPSILHVGLDMIVVQSKLGELGTLQIQEDLRIRQAEAAELLTEWKSLPTLPTGLSTTLHEDLYARTDRLLSNLRADLKRWSVEQPLIGHVARQIVLWTEPSTPEKNDPLDKPTDGDDEILGLTELDGVFSKACDSALVALQKLQEHYSTLPSSSEEASWLIAQERGIAASVKGLHVQEVLKSIDTALLQLCRLQLSGDDSARAASAVTAMAHPIMKQYANIHRQAVGRYASLHQSSCKMAYVLAKSFLRIATDGFCTPSEDSAPQAGRNERLEEGTGLGDGEGAQDISKDIQDDEDLSELAQEPNKNDENGDLEDEKDAVDMQDEMEGEIGDVSDKGEDDKGGSGDEDEDDMDEEVGDVDDLDPSAVDEKLWDEGDQSADKDHETDKSKGKVSKDEQAAAQEDDEAGENEEIDNVGVDEDEEIGREDPEKTDPRVQEAEALDLPEDMDLDGDQKSVGEDMGSDEMGQLSDFEDEKEGADEGNDVDDDEETAMDHRDIDSKSDGEADDNDETNDAEPVDEEEGDPNEDNQESLFQTRTEDAKVDDQNVVNSDVQGLGNDQEPSDDKTDPSSNAQRSKGSKDGTSAEHEAAAEDGQMGSQTDQKPEVGRSREEQPRDSSQSRAFKKLGDALERWHRQQERIQQASEGQDKPEQRVTEAENKDAEFEHLRDEQAEADTQALGAATEEQAHALDDSMALDAPEKAMQEESTNDGIDEAGQDGGQDVDMEDQPCRPGKDEEQEEQSWTGAMMSEAGRPGRETHVLSEDESEEKMDDNSKHLSTMQLSRSTTPNFLDPTEARSLWAHYENLTRSLSQTLTEQLRLILHPSLATKLRGDFRTGKRLNIKRIIPYIASQYRRDKIWLRRAVPHKRAYQILLAVDDSSSMAEHGAGARALQTLVMVARSLTMLEAGQIAVVAFGSTAHVAHGFNTPFSQDAGASILRAFGFSQPQTNVRRLLETSLDLFRAARNDPSGPSSDATDQLWQLQFIISDGLCEERDTLRRLVRRALGERIMIVFLIVDAPSTASSASTASASGRAAPPSTSILDMTQARFEPDESAGGGATKVRMQRYLDDFPFPYYIVVGDVRELPGVLATALRQWFGEVVDAQG